MLRIILAGGGAAAVLGLGLAVATSAQPISKQDVPLKAGPVTVTSCSLGQSASSVADNSLEIKYFQNVPRRHLVSVTFRVRYAGQVATVTDTGKFSYDAEIDHKFNALGGTPWIGPNPAVCEVVSATFGDGQTVRPHLASGGSEIDPSRGAPATVPPYASQPGAAATTPAPAAT